MRRLLATLGLATAAVTALSGCLVSTVSAPAGDGPLRYRDEVFARIVTTRDLTYGSAPDLEGDPVSLTLDLFQPRGDRVSARPAIVYVHSGGFAGGDKAEGVALMAPMVRRGFVAVSINYRLLAPGGCGGSDSISTSCSDAAAAAMQDAHAAVRWLRANAATYRIDKNRIAIEGFSAGGVVSTGVALLDDDEGTSGNPGFRSTVRAWVSIAGGLPDGQGAGAGDPPGYLFTGDADTTVPSQWSIDTAAAIDDANGFVALRVETGAGHVIPDQTMLAQQTANFYYLTMGLGRAQS